MIDRIGITLFCAFRAFCVPLFISHRLTELTDIISLDVTLFCALFLSHTEITELTEII